MTTATAPGAGAAAPDATTRQARLAEAAHRLRTRATGADPARVLFVVGSVLVPLGFALVLLGWWGAARTTQVWEQIPYLISGGVLGLGLVFAGGFCYFAYWLTELVRTARRDAAASLAALERLEAALAASSRSDGRLRARPAAATMPFVATATGSMFHRPECATVRGREDVRPVAADGAGLTPCGICRPLG